MLLLKYFGVTATIYLNVINVVCFYTLLYIAGTVSNSDYCTGVTCIIVLATCAMHGFTRFVLTH